MNQIDLNIPSLTVTPSQQAQLEAYVALLLKWNKSFNLIGRSTEADIWQRHILDAAQLVPLVEGAKTILDVGCGAGLPAVPLSILTKANVTACDRIQKKTDFVKEVRRALQLEAKLTVTAQDVREFSAQNQTFDVITARAVAPLVTLLELTEGLLAAGGCYIFLKGAEASQELVDVRAKYNMTEESVSSITSTQGEIIILRP